MQTPFELVDPIDPTGDPDHILIHHSCIEHIRRA
jgi:hypothetical protein